MTTLHTNERASENYNLRNAIHNPRILPFASAFGDCLHAGFDHIRRSDGNSCCRPRNIARNERPPGVNDKTLLILIIKQVIKVKMGKYLPAL